MKFSRSSGNLFIAAIFLCMSVVLGGCVYVIVGGLAAAGGYAVSRDTIQGETEESFDVVWESASEVMSIMGAVDSESYELGEIKGIVNGAKTTVNVIQMTPNTVRVKVKARKALFPSIANAQNVFVKIMNRVNGE